MARQGLAVVWTSQTWRTISVVDDSRKMLADSVTWIKCNTCLWTRDGIVVKVKICRSGAVS